MKICPFCNAQNKDANNFCIECGESLTLSKRDKMLNVLNNYKGCFFATPYVRSWSYKTFPEDFKKNLFKHDKAFNLANFVYIEDRSMLNNGKEGLIFMTNGFYDHFGPFAKSLFIRYRDIKRLWFESNCLNVETSEKKYGFALDLYDASLKDVLEALIEIDKTDGSDRIEYSEEKTGKVKGEGNSKHRRSNYALVDRLSKSYEAELRRRAAQFLQDKKRFIKLRDEYETLLNEYEEYIQTLENDNQTLTVMKSEYEKLKALGGK